MNTDKGHINDYEDVLSDKAIKDLIKILSEVDENKFNLFIEQIRYAVNFYRAERRSHDSIPDARDQERYYSKLSNNLSDLGTTISKLLNDTSFDFRREARKAGCPVEDFQDHIDRYIQILNEMEPSKSRYRPEVKLLVGDIAKAFREALEVEPVVHTFREKEDIKFNKLSIGERFVPVLSLLQNISIDQASRVATKYFNRSSI